MKKFTIGFFLSLALSANAIAAGPIKFEASVGSGTQDISGNLKYKGTTMSVKDTLGLEKKSQTVFNARLEHPIPVLPNLYFRYIPSSFSGSKTATTAITYGDQTFQANTTIKTDVEINRTDIGLFYNIPGIGLASAGAFDLEWGLNIRMVSFKGSMLGTVNNVAGVKEEKSVSTPIPQLFGRFAFTPIKKASINGEIRWISAGKNGLIDYTFDLRVRPVKILYLGLGYFKETLKLDTSDVVANIDITHPYFIIGAEF